MTSGIDRPPSVTAGAAAVANDVELTLACGSRTPCRRQNSELQAPPALDLLLTDESNPRALAFQLAAIEEHVKHLPASAIHAERAADFVADDQAAQRRRQHHRRLEIAQPIAQRTAETFGMRGMLKHERALQIPGAVQS